MTDRLVGATPGAGELANWQGWTAFQQRDPHMQRINADIDAGRLADAARVLLGWREVAFERGTQVFTRWQLQAADDVAGLPAGVVDTARRAALAEDAAYRAMVEHSNAALAWIQENAPADGKSHPMLSAAHAEAATAHRKASEQAVRALAELGKVAAELAAIRHELAELPTAQRADDADHAMRRQSRVTRERDLRARLAAFGQLT